MTETITLASGGPSIKAVLTMAGVSVVDETAIFDEQAAETTLKDSGTSPEDVALIIAEAKATEVSGRQPTALVLGCTQTLSVGDEIVSNPTDMEGARRRLLALSGKTHQLNSAAVLVRGGMVVWRHVGVANLTLRKLDPGFIGRHLSRIGNKALQNVSVYGMEGEGIQLFEKIEGDHFTLLGLPLLPVLAELHRLGAIDG